VSPAAPLCADGARERGDDLVGTAAPARRWLLVEHPGPWAVDALAGSGIAAEVQDRLRLAAHRSGARILLVRRPGRQPAQRQRSWAVVDAGSTAVRRGAWSADEDLLAAVTALSDPAGAQGTATRDGAPGPDEPLLLVCAHGRHDTCCAVRGRPVADRLAQRWPAGTWECSHVGGDRFAANLLVLPDGACYGNLDAETAVDVATSHLQGRVDVDHLRGVSTQPPVAQAAIAAALRRYGPAALSQVGVSGVEPRGSAAWRVILTGTGPVPPRVEATVLRTRTAPARLTCRAAGSTSAYRYEVPDLHEVGAP
jgi:hypothetical protein